MPKIDRMAVLFSINSYVAAMLALWIGFRLDLPRPYWAVMTAYIISQPLAGAVRSKAVYRVVGTLLGASFSVLIVPIFINAPVLLCIALALWVGVCLGISLLDRTPRAYVVMLAGYTAALVVFPTVDQPDQIFDVAVSRVEEILLGILCATVVHSISFPRPVGLVLRQRLDAWLAEGDAWVLDLLRGHDSARIVTDRRHLAAAATEIHLLSVLLPFDVSHLRNTGSVVRALHQRLLLLIPTLSGVGDRLAALRRQTEGFSAELTAILESMADWVAAGAPERAGGTLRKRLTDLKSATLGPGWTELLQESLLTRLNDVVENLGEAHALMSHLRVPPTRLSPALAEAVAKQVKRPLHLDIGMAVVSGLSVVVAILLVCALWILTGWPHGGVAAALVAVYCAFFAALDDPAPAIKVFGVFGGLSIPVAAFYQFAILPGIDGFSLLAFVLAPVFLVCGVCMVDRRTALPATAFVLSFASALAFQETYSVDFAAFVNINCAQYVAMFVALVVTKTMRSLSVEAAARRLLVRTWATLAALAQCEMPVNPLDLAAELVDRLGLLTPKLAAAGRAPGEDGLDALTDLRIAMNLALIQVHRADFTLAQDRMVDDTLIHVGRHFTALSAGRTERPTGDLLTALDRSLAAVAPIGDVTKRSGVAALVGLRRNLCPDAPAYVPASNQEPAP